MIADWRLSIVIIGQGIVEIQGFDVHLRRTDNRQSAIGNRQSAMFKLATALQSSRFCGQEFFLLRGVQNGVID
jgi:hypothetical protein